MKLTVKKEAKEKRRPAYPYFGRWKNDGDVFVVLFTAPNTGTLIVANSPRPTRPVGHVYAGWEEAKYVPFYGTITIEED